MVPGTFPAQAHYLIHCARRGRQKKKLLKKLTEVQVSIHPSAQKVMASNSPRTYRRPKPSSRRQQQAKQIDRVQLMATLITNKKNHMRLRTPTQLQMNGQWWSKYATQRLQIRQCFALRKKQQLHYYYYYIVNLCSSGVTFPFQHCHPTLGANVSKRK